MTIERSDAVLVVIDMQEKLMPVIDSADDVIRNIECLVRGFHILGIPAIVTEQYPRGLGTTVAPVRRSFEETAGFHPIEKSCFSAHGCEAFVAQLTALDRHEVVVAGVETHVCVYQTVEDLLAAGLQVSLVADAVSSRTPENKEIALRRLTRDGAKLTSTEMVLFELTRVSGSDEFRSIAKLIK